MKHYKLLLIACGLLFSCASLQKKNTDKEVINTYLQTVVYNKKYIKIFVAEDPLPGKESLEVYEIALREKNLEPSHLGKYGITN
ncbi:hypothetical protein OGH69_04990 [Flavobacterium sp. MFBS3-15]|uniref:hypothetical protein n=1 Tax=Flavobacterium sp. MFBS3-15 TaxID=2989816 RepID=UPI00223613C3|nr:hypothetical protein [Flavobacterium sp. MFBS3-15]MCW4468314.1 hypothetical protein [Flavobacterium sp. MFBS3-15]